MAVLAYNNSISSVTKMTPFEIINCHIKNDSLNCNDEILSPQDYVSKHSALSKFVFDTVHNRIINKKEKVLEKRNLTREDPPDLKQPVYRKLVKRIANQKTSPRFQVSKINKFNKDRGTLAVVNPRTNVKQKIHVDQTKRPKKRQGTLFVPDAE